MLTSWFKKEAYSTGLESFYFEFDGLDKTFRQALELKTHILLYGPPRQGKTMFVRRALRDRKTITLHASEDFGFADMSRNMLLSLGCSVITEQKRKRRAQAKAEIKFTWPFAAAISPINPTASAEGGVESEHTFRSFTADIANPNDVCHMLAQLEDVPIIVIEHFERLKQKDRNLLIEFLQISAENRAVQVVLVASSLEVPLKYRERIQLNRIISIIHLPLMTKAATEALVRAALKHLEGPSDLKIADLIHERLSGNVEMTIEVCALIHSKYRSVQGVTNQMNFTFDDFLNLEFQQRSKNYFMAFLSSIVEAGWEIRCSRRQTGAYTAAVRNPSDGAVAASGDNKDDRTAKTTGAVVISDTWRSDQIFIELQQILSNASPEIGLTTDERQKLAPLLKAMRTAGRKLVACETPSESVRLLAFAMRNFLTRPLANYIQDYVPANDGDILPINMGVVICDMLRRSDLTKPVLLTDEILKERLESYGLTLISERRRNPVRKLAKRILRLQRDLFIDPALIQVDLKNDEIVLWQPQMLSLYGDITSDLERLLDDEEDNPFFEEMTIREKPLHVLAQELSPQLS